MDNKILVKIIKKRIVPLKMKEAAAYYVLPITILVILLILNMIIDPVASEEIDEYAFKTINIIAISISIVVSCVLTINRRLLKVTTTNSSKENYKKLIKSLKEKKSNITITNQHYFTLWNGFGDYHFYIFKNSIYFTYISSTGLKAPPGLFDSFYILHRHYFKRKIKKMVL